MPKVAVVILNFNGRQFLEDFLQGFILNSDDAHIIVADNDSSDDSIDFLNAHFPEITQIKLDSNLGFAGGYNKALEQVDAEFYAIVNSDIEVTPNWLAPLVDFLDHQPKHAAVQPKIKAFHNKGHFEYAGAAGGFVDNFGYPFCRGRIFEHLEKDKGQYDTVIDVDWVSGACMVVRSEVFHKMTGFEESFFAHMEEIDLCWRMRSAGWKLACNPGSTVYHVGGGTLQRSSPYKTYLNFRNGLSLLVKNLPTSQLIWKLPIRLTLDGIAALKFSLESSPKHLFAILKAHFHFYGSYFNMINKKTITSPPRKASVLWQHFVKGKKTFSEIDPN